MVAIMEIGRLIMKPTKISFMSALLVSTLSTMADQQWDKVGYTEGKGATDHRSMSKFAKNTIYSCNFSALGGSL